MNQPPQRPSRQTALRQPAPTVSPCNDADFQPTASWDRLKLRASLLARLRAFFHEQGFLEVETPLLSADVVVDRHIEPFCVAESCPDPTATEDVASPAAELWLQTSPEFAMKRLLAAGGEAIYQVTRSFRRGERGPLHNPEFTLVEWYRRGDRMADGIQLLCELVDCLLDCGQAERLSYRDALHRYAGVDPFAADVALLRQAAQAAGIAIPHEMGVDRDGWLDLLFVERVMPNLGAERPVIVYDYPPSQAALARLRDEDPPVAERFELFLRGVELANGYHELLDGDELRRRNRQMNVLRQADGRRALPEDSRLLDAMDAGLPPCTGVALGFDRLVMLAAGATSIDEVLAFPFERA